MDTAGKGSNKKGKRRKESGKAPARKSSARPRKLAFATHLIQQLRQIVFPSPNNQATRRQVLHQTQTYIQELENTLDSLLKMRGHFKVEENGSSSLEDVKEEYMQMYFCQEQGGALPNTTVTSDSEPTYWHLHSDIEMELGEVVEKLLIDDSHIPDSPSSPDLIEFERYLHFYRQTMDMLTESRVVSPEQIAEPVVSKAIANLWQDLKREGDVGICHYAIPQAQSTPCLLSFQSDPGCSDESAKENSTGSQEATSSFLSSTPEEILLEDAFDVAAGFLDPEAIQSTSSPSCLHTSSPWESPEGNICLYQQVYDFLRSNLSSYTKTSAQHFDYETVLLRCTETFDDEDDL